MRALCLSTTQPASKKSWFGEPDGNVDGAELARLTEDELERLELEERLDDRLLELPDDIDREDDDCDDEGCDDDEDDDEALFEEDRDADDRDEEEIADEEELLEVVELDRIEELVVLDVAVTTGARVNAEEEREELELKDERELELLSELLREPKLKDELELELELDAKGVRVVLVANPGLELVTTGGMLVGVLNVTLGGGVKVGRAATTGVGEASSSWNVGLSAANAAATSTRARSMADDTISLRTCSTSTSWPHQPDICSWCLLFTCESREKPSGRSFLSFHGYSRFGRAKATSAGVTAGGATSLSGRAPQRR